MIDAWLTSKESAAAAPASQHLSFWLGEQCYALPVIAVQEIRAMGASSILPGSPPWVLGIMNLRGLVIPVIDLRRRFGIAAARETGAAAVMIVASAGGKLGGIVVDGVRDVCEIAPESLRPVQAAVADTVDARCVAAVATLGEEVVIVLDAMALLLGQWAGAAHQTPPQHEQIEKKENEYAGLVR